MRRGDVSPGRRGATWAAATLGLVLAGSASAQSTGLITTVAGSGPGTMPAVEASLRGNIKVVSDAAGNLYVSCGFAHRVYRFDRQAGSLSPLAGTGFPGNTGDGGPALEARIDNPYALALDEGRGRLYIQDGRFVRAVELATGAISRFLGNGGVGALVDDMPATEAPIGSIADLAVDALGVVYFATDTGGWRIWAVENGTLRAVAGSGVARGPQGGDPADDYRDGVPATSASLGAVSAIAVVGQNLYFYEQASLPGGARYRRVDLVTGTLTTYAGNGYVYGSFDGPGGDPRDDVVENAPALQSALGYTTSMTADPASGDLYGLIYTIGLVRRVSSNGDGTAGTVLTAAGGGPSRPLNVPPKDAYLPNPSGLGRDEDGKLYVAAGSFYDFDGFAVYGATPDAIGPVVGNGYRSYCGDGGPASDSCLSRPSAARPDGTGQLLIADEGNHAVRMVGPSATISSLIPHGGLFDGVGDLWPLGVGAFLFSNTPRHTVYSTAPPYSSYTTFAGTGFATGSIDGEGGDPGDDLGDGELAWVASLNAASGLVRDAQGNTFIADTGNHRVRRIDAVTGVIRTVAGTGARGEQCDLGLPATTTDLLTPKGLAFAPNGDLLVVEQEGQRVRRIQAGADGLVTGEDDETIELVAGRGPSGDSGFAGDGGPGSDALLNSPTSVAVDALGNVYVGDNGNHAIRRVHAQTGIIDTIAGRGDDGDGMPAVRSRLDEIVGLSTEVVNGRRYLYVTDRIQERIRRIDLGPAQGPENQPPVVQPLGLNGATLTATSPAGASIGLYASAFDPDGDLLTYSWSGPFGMASGVGAVVRLPIGVSTVTVAVDDGRGHVVTESATVNVVGQNTFTGNGEVVNPPDDHEPRRVGETRGLLTVTFLGPVTTPGLTWFRTRTDQSPRPPAGKQLGSAPFYYDIGTTAVATGDVRICVDLTGMSFAFPDQVELHRLGGTWTGLGVSPDPLTPVVCAQAPFAQAFGTYANFTPADPATLVTTVAGIGQAEDTGDGGPAGQAGLNIPEALAFDRARNLLYIGQGSHRVRRVNLTDGRIETIAGTGSVVDPVDGVDARLSSIGSIAGLVLDAEGHLFIGDTSHCLVRRVDLSTNLITTVAGNWRGPGLSCGHTGDGGPATAARIGFARRLAFDAAGNLLFSEQPTLPGDDGGFIRRLAAGPDHRITGDDPAETITTVAGNGLQDVLVPDGIHPLNAGLFPWGLAVSPIGDLYVAEGNGVLRLAPGVDGLVDGSADETVTRVLGTPLGFPAPFQGDGGPARSSYSAFASGLAVLPSGDVIVADPFLRRIRRISAGADGVVGGGADERIVTVAGFSDDQDPAVFNGDGYALSTRFAWPTEVAIDGTALFVADPMFHRVRRFGLPSVGVGPLAPLVIEVSESILVTDTPLLRPSVMLTVPENIVVTDEPALTPSLVLTVAENIVLTDAPALTPSLMLTVAENIVVTDGPELTPIVAPAPTTTTLASSGLNAFTTRPPVFTATVGTSAPAPATGTVEFFADGASLGLAPLFDRGGLRVAVMGGATLSVGTHTITASYRGDGSHQPSETAPQSQTVIRGDYVTVDLTPSFTDPSEATAVNAHDQVVGFSSSFDPRVGFTSATGFLYSGGGLANLDGLGGTRTVPLAINDLGQVVGRSATASNLDHAFLYQSGQMTDLGTLGGNTSQAVAVNNAGQIVGVSEAASGSRAFLHQAGTLGDLGTLGGTGSGASAINAFGLVAGHADLADGTRRAAYYTNSWLDLGTLGGTTSRAAAINAAGQVAGTANLPGDLDAHAFLWHHGTLVDIAGPSGPSSHAFAINDAGQVVGWTFDSSAWASHEVAPPPRNAFLYSRGQLTELAAASGGTSLALDISGAGLLVGVSDGRAFVSAGGPVRDLGTLGGATSHARAINDRGLIVGAADTASGLAHAVAWVPVPVPTLTVMPAAGPAGGTATLTATLTLFGLPVPNQPIAFRLIGVAVGSATTDATGTATLAAISLAGLAEGTYPGAVHAAYAGQSVIVGATEATGDLTVTPRVDHPPVAYDDVYPLGSGPLSIAAPGVLANDLDADGDVLVAELVSGPNDGTVTLNPDGSFTYHPGPGARFGDSFTYRAFGAGVASNLATVSLRAGSVQPRFEGIVSAPWVTINGAPGRQTEPRVSGDLLSYTNIDQGNNSQVHYYRFSTGSDAPIPAGPIGANDSLSEVNENRVVFSRTLPDGSTGVVLFDASTSQLTDIDPRPGSTRFGATIGGDTIAFAEFEAGIADIQAWNLGTSSREAVTTSPASEGFVRLVPDGSVLVLQGCSGQNCDINKASRVGGAWVVAPVTETPETEGHPDSDGTWIVYEAHGRPENPTGSGIYLRRVAGGPETYVAIPGQERQREPSISRGVITFLGMPIPSRNFDVFVYVIADNTLYQVTDTPMVNEGESDVSVLPNGDIRVVWSADYGSVGEQKIHAVTFTPGTVVQPPRRLSVTRTGSGTGVVTSTPTGIACGVTCSALFGDATLVTLTPTPNPNFVFGGWSGDPDCADGLVTMNADKSCTAAFNRRPDLAVTALGTPGTAGAGATITVTDVTRNAASAAPAGPSRTGFYISSDPILGAGDTFVGSRPVTPLPPGASQAGTTAVTLPAGLSPGIWFVIAKADFDDTTVERDETNNTRARAILVRRRGRRALSVR